MFHVFYVYVCSNPLAHDSNGEFKGTCYTLLLKIIKRACSESEVFDKAFRGIVHFFSSKKEQENQTQLEQVAKALKKVHDSAPNNEKANIIAPMVKSKQNPNGLSKPQLEKLGFELSNTQFANAQIPIETRRQKTKSKKARKKGSRRTIASRVERVFDK